MHHKSKTTDMKMKPIYVLIAALAAGFASCTPAETVGVTGVTVAETLDLRIGAKDSETLTAVIEPQDATNRKVTWSIPLRR